MVNLTLVEVHLDESTFEAIAPFGKKTPQRTGEEGDVQTENDGSAGTILGVFIGLIFLASIAYVLRKKVFSNGSSETFDDEEEIEIEDIEI